jgi:hypothetical protein
MKIPDFKPKQFRIRKRIKSQTVFEPEIKIEFKDFVPRKIVKTKSKLIESHTPRPIELKKLIFTKSSTLIPKSNEENAFKYLAAISNRGGSSMNTIRKELASDKFQKT